MRLQRRRFLEIDQSETRKQTWLLPAILVSDWSMSKKSSPLKLLGQMNQNLVESIYGSSSVNIAHFVPIR
jgi:hypothetical protein